MLVPRKISRRGSIQGVGLYVPEDCVRISTNRNLCDSKPVIGNTLPRFPGFAMQWQIQKAEVMFQSGSHPNGQSMSVQYLRRHTLFIFGPLA